MLEEMLTSVVITEASLILPSTDGCGALRSSKSKLSPLYYDSKLLSYGGILRGYSSFCIPKLGGLGAEKYLFRGLTPRASGSSNGDLIPVVPLQFESPVGQFLAQILQTHRHLLPAAIDQQLENLQTGSDAQRKEPSPSSEDLLLYRRIAEVKQKERERALEEITYFLTVQKFHDNGISMIPKISASSNPTGRVDFWPNQEQNLESIHSPEALEMVQSHLSFTLEALLGPPDTIVHISKIQLGKLYAASIMYGYFLKRVDERFQLESTARTLPESFEKGKASYLDPAPSSQLWDPDSLIMIWPDDVGGTEGGSITDSSKGKTQRLRSYIEYLDSETLTRYATMRTKAAISLIEKQTQALFGRPDIQIADDGSLEASNDEGIGMTFSGVTLLILEAVAFGSFLWDAEGHVEAKIHSDRS